MGTVKRKLQIMSPYSIGSYESWLSDQAARGLFVKKFGFTRCTFEKAEPARMEYRIDISKESVSAERKAMYEDCGWKYIGSCKWAHIFGAAEGTYSAEIHTDVKEQGFTLADLTRTLTILLPLIVIMVAFEIALCGYMLFMNGTPFLNMISEGYAFMCMVFAVLLAFVVFLKQFFDIRALKKSLFSGKAINHHESWKKHKYYTLAITLVALTIICISLLDSGFNTIHIIRAVTGSSWSTMTAQTKLPCLQLSDLENLDNAVTGKEFSDQLHAAYEDGSVDDIPGDTLIWDSGVKTEGNLLAMTQFKVKETAGTRDGLYDSGLDTQYYKLTFAGMADGMLHDLMKKNLYTYTEEMMLDVNIKKMDFDGLDIVYTAKAQGSIFIFASKGNIVVSMQYYGTKSEPELIAALAKKLNENM